jgi:hypothetical protein
MQSKHEEREARGAKHLASSRAKLQSSTNESSATRHSDAPAAAVETRLVGSKGAGTAEPLQKHVDQTSRAGTHSGKSNVGVPISLGGDDNAATAYNGGTVNAQSAMPSRPPMPVPQSE